MLQRRLPRLPPPNAQTAAAEHEATTARSRAKAAEAAARAALDRAAAAETEKGAAEAETGAALERAAAAEVARGVAEAKTRVALHRAGEANTSAAAANATGEVTAGEKMGGVFIRTYFLSHAYVTPWLSQVSEAQRALRRAHKNHLKL
jgi:hypothetical protein